MKNDTEPQSMLQLRKDVRDTRLFFYVFNLFASIVVVWHTGFTSITATALLWALAWHTFGSMLGFLFGIPKILQSNKPDSIQLEETSGQPILYRQQVNTNLTEISDWLTKIIVGLGLINLKDIPLYINGIADTLSTSINAADPAKEKGFALALLLFFPVMGFFFGYLNTRLSFARAFFLADLASLYHGSDENRKELDERRKR